MADQQQKFLTPEDFGVIMGASSYPEMQELLKQQLANAEQLRGGMPQTEMYGRVAVAPNPLQYLAHGVNNVRGNKQQQAAMEQYQRLIDELRKARETYGANVMGQE